MLQDSICQNSGKTSLKWTQVIPKMYLTVYLKISASIHDWKQDSTTMRGLILSIILYNQYKAVEPLICKPSLLTFSGYPTSAFHLCVDDLLGCVLPCLQQVHYQTGYHYLHPHGLVQYFHPIHTTFIKLCSILSITKVKIYAMYNMLYFLLYVMVHNFYIM